MFVLVLSVVVVVAFLMISKNHMKNMRKRSRLSLFNGNEFIS